MIRCPKCDEELEVQEADPDVGNLRAKLDIAISALEFARDGYERIDIKHIEYRVGVYTTACDALDKIALPSIPNPQPHAVSQEEARIDTLRLKAFKTNDPNDRQTYFDATSKWFQDRHYRRMGKTGGAG